MIKFIPFHKMREGGIVRVSDPTRRFSDRVENYVRYRPGYPRAVLELLKEECGLRPVSVVADVGSGTGILSRLFLDGGCRVYGVEPNREMREAGERLLADRANFVSVDGTAEATGLAEASVDFVAAGQAFHWFETEASRAEFARILKPEGWTVLVWNDRRTRASAFLKDYERLLLEHGTDYAQGAGREVAADSIEAFFAPGWCERRAFRNEQVFDWEGLKGRVMSASYVPAPGHPRHGPMLKALRALFDRHEKDGAVVFEYDTNVYYGRLLERKARD